MEVVDSGESAVCDCDEGVAAFRLRPRWPVVGNSRFGVGLVLEWRGVAAKNGLLSAADDDRLGMPGIGEEVDRVDREAASFADPREWRRIDGRTDLAFSGSGGAAGSVYDMLAVSVSRFWLLLRPTDVGVELGVRKQ